MFNYLREIYGYRGVFLLWAGVVLNSLPFGMLMTMHPLLPESKKHAHKETYHKDGVRESNCNLREHDLPSDTIKEMADDEDVSRSACCREFR